MFLYRYEKAECNRIKTLHDGEIWMSLPSSFNDPLDCQLKISNEIGMSTFNEERLKKATMALYENYGESGLRSLFLSEDIIISIREWADGSDVFARNKPSFINLMEEKVKGFGIQCFSELVDSQLMWSHYADSHKGFCIEYDYSPMGLAAGNKSDFAMSPAIYTSLLPEFSLSEVIFSPEEVIPKFYTTKSDYWSYEREYRLIYFACSAEGASSGQRVNLPQGLSVRSIIAGMNIDSNRYGDLKEVAHYLGASFEKMELDSRSYSLIRKPQN